MGQGQKKSPGVSPGLCVWDVGILSQSGLWRRYHDATVRKRNWQGDVTTAPSG